MAQIIAFAAFVALAGGVLFGYSRFEKKNKQAQIEQVSQPALLKANEPEANELLVPTLGKVASTPQPKEIASEVQFSPIADPWTVEATIEPSSEVARTATPEEILDK